MADISKFTLPSGSVYNIKDATARSEINTIKSSLTGALHYRGVTSTVLVDGSTANPITIGGQSFTPQAGDVVFYGDLEFVWSETDTKWHEMGSTGSLKALAFKDSASGNYKPAGTVSKPTFTGTKATLESSYTPAGTVTISTGTGTANYTPAGTVAAPTFTGTEGNVSVSGTPTGTVSISKGTGTANYTPEGTVSAPTVTVTPNTSSVTPMSGVGTLPTCTLPQLTMTVANENLTIGWAEGSFSQGTLPTKGTAVTVVTGIKSATASAPTFTGTGAQLKATFSGSAFTSSGKFTPSGTVSAPKFTGTGVQLKGTFSGTQGKATVEYTPAGTVSQPTFTGTQATITVS